MKLNPETIAKRERHLQRLETEIRISELNNRLKMCGSTTGPGIDRYKVEWRRELITLRSKMIDLHDERKPITATTHRGQRERAAFIK